MNSRLHWILFIALFHRSDVCSQDFATRTTSTSFATASENNTLPNAAFSNVPRLNFLSSDSRPDSVEDWLTQSIKVRGRIETDAILAVQSSESKEIIGDLRNGYGFRRMRLGAQGTIGDVARWVSEVELAGGTPRLRDVFIGYQMFPWVRELRVGYFREPFSLEGNTSTNFMTFMERSPLNELDPTRNWGVCGYWWPDDERMTAALGVFRDGTNNGGQSQGDDDAWALTGRITSLPVYVPDDDNFQLLHLGSAISLRSPKDGLVIFDPGVASNLLTVSDDPASPFLPAVIFNANSQQIYNLQAAWVNGSASWQAEWFATSIQQTNAGTVFLHGFYIDYTYFLTGEHRGYDRTRGAFDQVKVLRPALRTRDDPRGGMGAVELLARFSYADFNSPNMPPAISGEPAGAYLYQLTLGVNWYLNNYMRMMFNYTAAMPDDINQDPTMAHLFSFRFALFW